MKPVTIDCLVSQTQFESVYVFEVFVYTAAASVSFISLPYFTPFFAY